MKCGACGKAGLQSTQLAVVLSREHGFAQRRVCGECFRAALHVIGAAEVRSMPETKVAEQERETRDVLRALARHFRSFVTAYAGPVADHEATGLEHYVVGRRDAFTTAAETCEQWALRPNVRGAS